MPARAPAVVHNFPVQETTVAVSVPLMHRAPDDDLQALLAESSFLRALARQLVVGDADEVVQQTWLQALQQGCAGIQRPRSWLARIARNVASNLHRGDKRRREREREAAAHELVPSSAELMQHEERRRELVSAIDGLPPKLRTVVLLRWFDGWPPRRIARELGVAPATVSTQLQRALKLLRLKLDAEHGGSRRAWLLPLLPLAVQRSPRGPPPGSLASPLVPGVFAMTTKTKLAVAAAIFAVAGVWLWWPGDGAAGVSRLMEEPSEPLAARFERPQVPKNDTAADATPERRVVAPPEAATTGGLVVRARYAADDTPAGNLLLILRRPGTDPRFEGWRQRTDGDGMARFEDLPPGRLYVATNCDPGQHVEIRAGETAELDYAIPAGLHLSGIVVDDAGVPVAGAVVEVAPMAHANAYPEVVATTGADGRFAARSCPRACLVGARAAGFRASPVRFLFAKDGNTAQVRLVLGGDGCCVDGQVVQAGGRPVAGAVVIIGAGQLSGIAGRDHLPPFAALVRSDEDGRFRAVGIPPGAHPVQARAVGLAPWRGRVEVAAGQTVPLRLELAPGATIRGLVRNAAGAPVAHAEVEIGSWRDIAHYRTLTSAGGTFEFTGLAAGEIELRAVHDEFGAGETSVRTVAGDVTDCELELSRGLELLGRVLARDGRPMSKVLIECTSEDRKWFAFVHSDTDGRFAVANCPESGTLRVTAQGRGIEELLQTGVDPRAGELVLRVRSALPRSVRITGTVLGPDGRPVGNAAVGGWRQGARGGTGLAATDDAGRFELGLLVPGAWQVYVRSAAHPEFRSAVRDLAANEVWDLGTIRLPLGGTAVVNGAGDLAQARFYVSNPAVSRSWTVGAVEGRLQSSVLAPGSYLLLVRGTGVAAHSVPFVIHAGQETSVNVRLEPGIAQRFEVALPVRSPAVNGVSLRVTRGDDFVGRAWASVRPGKPPAVDMCLSPGEFEVAGKAGKLRGRAKFTVGAKAGAPVRIVLR